jgi:transcriptional regulator with XRE-family HTH domain
MSEINSKWVGNRLRAIRLLKQLSQEAVANDLGISLTAYANIEQGKTNIPFNRLLEIATYFNISIPSFFNTQDIFENNALTNDSLATSNKNLAELEKEIAYLKQIIIGKDKIITLLENQLKSFN